MEPKAFSKKLAKLASLGLAILTVLAILFFQKLPDGKLHLIFCDVGQGDAILVITPTGAQMLVDGGPNNSVLSCLGENLPFYDKNLELVVLTHPQADHLTGLVSVFENYTVEKVLKTEAVNNTAEFEAYKLALKKEGTRQFLASSGLQINFGQFSGKILWPAKDSILLGSDLNDTSIILQLDFGEFCALLTGDATNKVWYQLAAQGGLNNCFLLKIAHHGSKNATNDLILASISPKIAIISAGVNNRHGHPHPEIVEKLEEREIKIFRTDLNGTIEIITDGKSVQVN